MGAHPAVGIGDTALSCSCRRTALGDSPLMTGTSKKKKSCTVLK